MAGQHGSGILGASAAFEKRFVQVAELSDNVHYDGQNQGVGEGECRKQPVMNRHGRRQAATDIAHRPFNRFSGTDQRRQLMPPEGASDEIRRNVPGHDDYKEKGEKPAAQFGRFKPLEADEKTTQHPYIDDAVQRGRMGRK